jgi:hypothetical protein
MGSLRVLFECVSVYPVPGKWAPSWAQIVKCCTSVEFRTDYSTDTRLKNGTSLSANPRGFLQAQTSWVLASANSAREASHLEVSHPVHDAGAAAGGGAWQIKGVSGAHSAWLTKPCVGRHEAGVAEVVELMAILVVASGAAVASIA